MSEAAANRGREYRNGPCGSPTPNAHLIPVVDSARFAYAVSEVATEGRKGRQTMSLVGLGLSAHLGQRKGASQAGLCQDRAHMPPPRHPNIGKGTRMLGPKKENPKVKRGRNREIHIGIRYGTERDGKQTLLGKITDTGMANTRRSVRTPPIHICSFRPA